MPIINNDVKFNEEKNKISDKFKEKAIQDASMDGLLKMIDLICAENKQLKDRIIALEGGA